MLYERLQRDGLPAPRLHSAWSNQDRNVFGACMVATGDADGMVTGVTRNYSSSVDSDVAPRDRREAGPACSIGDVDRAVARHGTVFVADTAINGDADGRRASRSIAMQMAAHAARRHRASSRAWRSSPFSNFGQPQGERSEKVIAGGDASSTVARVDFEYDGEMSADVALNPRADGRPIRSAA